jgi:hypothetical protein
MVLRSMNGAVTGCQHQAGLVDIFRNLEVFVRPPGNRVGGLTLFLTCCYILLTHRQKKQRMQPMPGQHEQESCTLPATNRSNEHGG